MNKGIFTVSLDFELHWGTRDSISFDSYKENLLGVRKAIPAILELFAKYEVHATWAAVGLLLFENKDEMLQSIPDKLPAYVKTGFSPYQYIANVGSGEEEDPFHYGASLVKLIRSYPFQEIGTHTFSHYYCLEEGQNNEIFEADLRAVMRIMRNKYQETVKSLVFPKNQIQEEYLASCLRHGILGYRGTPRHWLYDPRKEEQNSLMVRLFRLLDTFCSLTGHHTYKLSEISGSKPYNMRASRFLRPYSKKLGLLEPLKIRRIKKDLAHAAKSNSMYHLWWHPHNFGKDIVKNISLLQEILCHYSKLKSNYGIKSFNMGEIAEYLIQKEYKDAKNCTADR